MMARNINGDPERKEKEQWNIIEDFYLLFSELSEHCFVHYGDM